MKEFMKMATDFAYHVARMFARQGEAATYTPVGGTAKSIMVMPKRADAVTDIEGMPILSRAALFEIQVADIATVRRGDTLVFGADTYTVQSGRYADGGRLIWLVDTFPAESDDE